MKKKLLALLALGAALALAALPVLADPNHATAPICLPVEAVASHARDAGFRAVELSAAQRATFLRAFNAQPPATHYAPAGIWAIAGASSPLVLVMFVDAHGCVTKHGEMPAEEFADDLAGGGKQS